MKLFIISGEASGDLHGGNLAKELFRQQPELEIRGWGGENMEDAGVTVLKHYRELAFMGFVEVVANLRTISKNFKLCTAQIEEFKPDVVIMIDYPGFNLRMAKKVKAMGIPVFYYISPQVWAWKESRVKQIKEFVDEMFVILPFEEDFYQKHNYPVHFVGHPLLDVTESAVDEDFRQKNGLDERPIIAMIPGSRKQEISRMLAVMNTVKPHFPDHQFVIAGVRHADESLYQQHAPGVPVVTGQTYALFRAADAGMVTSGTATLEAALNGMPEVVCYKGGYISYRIARALIKVKYISLVNLIMDREVVRELIQAELNMDNLVGELKQLLDPAQKPSIDSQYRELREKLGGPGASQRTANAMLKILKQ